KGAAPSQLRLGQLYEGGEGILRNFVEAVRWYGSAAEQGAVPAMARLGEIYLTGLAAPDTATPAALMRLEEEGSVRRQNRQGVSGASLLHRRSSKPRWHRVVRSDP